MGIKSTILTRLHNRYKKLETKSHPLNYLFLEITRKCNLNCLHCGSDCKHETSVPELTTESWLKIIDFVYDNISEKVTFIITGGEPLMHKDLFEIGGHIHKKGMKWAMVTNGMLLSEDVMRKLETEGLSSLTISLDGPEIQHNKLRNSGVSFKKVMSALDVLGKSAIMYKDSVTCVYPDNLAHLDETAEILIEKGISSWRLFRIFPSGRAEDNKDLLLSFEQTKQMVDWIAKNKKSYAKRGLNINLSCEGWLPMETDKQVRDFPFICRAGINIASVLCDGTITGCNNNHSSFYEGNILKDNLAYLWQNGFKKFRERDWIKGTLCENCGEIKNCGGGSIHLWNLEKNRPGFCYFKDIEK